ncbi:hypothetical protein AVEN_60334-1 [Araneus ventricosus]|uniref:Uncharacterized protein n=1 Tax=Araneus ventricosus TaxID=182803 RepID=A0A4Y2PFZ4_ARAVE|nr:hypothetical protein AVEN_255978-1 [Araneus ventricosus]GBN49426.1 hypothetical protein AVEN_60334-1 [Araneus ventricosus]
MLGSWRIPLAICSMLMTATEHPTTRSTDVTSENRVPRNKSNSQEHMSVCSTPFDDRDQLLWIIRGQAIDGLWKGDHSRCQSDVKEWTADLCGANPQSHFDTHETL